MDEIRKERVLVIGTGLYNQLPEEAKAVIDADDFYVVEDPEFATEEVVFNGHTNQFERLIEAPKRMFEAPNIEAKNEPKWFTRFK